MYSAEEQNFINSISMSTREELLDTCLLLFRDRRELMTRLSANEKINTESYLQYQRVKSENDSLHAENRELKELLEKEIQKNNLMTRSTFGRKTEKILSLIDSAENREEDFQDEEQSEDAAGNPAGNPAGNRSGVIVPADRDEKEKENESGKKARSGAGKKGKKNRLAVSMEKLPKEILYDIDVEELNRKYGEGNWRIVFWHDHTTLEKIDTPYYQKVVYTPVISSGLEHRLVSEPFENPLIDRSVASASILGDMLYRKFVLSLPCNRQASDYQTQGVDITKQNIINWFAKVVPAFMEPVVEYMTECLMSCKYTQNDETYIQVNKDGRGPGHKSFLWVHCGSEYLDCDPIVIFCYEATRNTDHLRSFYGEFMGYITCDAYISYQVFAAESQGNVTVTGCFMHCRRYFAEAFFVNDIASLSDEQLKELPETKALLLIRDIYHEENELKDLSADERLTIRKEKVSPLVDRFFEFVHELDKSEEVRSDRLKKAVTYAVNQEERLKVFLTDGNICCDNGSSERKIRAYSIGRANWLFADTVFGAGINATMYSIVETAKANRVNVQIYLRYLLEEMPKHKDETDRAYLEDMVPWSEAYKRYEADYTASGHSLLQNLFSIPERPKNPVKNQIEEAIDGRSEMPA